MPEIVPSIAGISIIHYMEAVSSLHGGKVLEEGLLALPEGDRNAVAGATPLGWVPVDSVAAAVEAWARAAGVSADQLTVDGVRLATRASFSTVWRVFLGLTGDGALISRTPMIYSKTRNVGEMRAHQVDTRWGRFELTDWPGVRERQILSIAVSIETITELTGRPNAACRFLPTEDGAVFDLTWSARFGSASSRKDSNAKER